MSTVTAQAIRDSLKQCMDPEVPLNIVDMGLIYGIDVVENNDVNITSKASAPACQHRSVSPTSVVGTKRKCHRRLATSAIGGLTDITNVVRDFRC